MSMPMTIRQKVAMRAIDYMMSSYQATTSKDRYFAVCKARKLYIRASLRPYPRNPSTLDLACILTILDGIRITSAMLQVN